MLTRDGYTYYTQYTCRQPACGCTQFCISTEQKLHPKSQCVGCNHKFCEHSCSQFRDASSNFTDIAREAEQCLASEESSVDFQAQTALSPIFSASQYRTAMSCQDENVFLNFLCPIVQYIIDDNQMDIVMVSSEDFKWLSRVSVPPIHQSPGLFFCHPINVQLKFPSTCDIDGDRLFGIVPHSALFPGISIGDCKLSKEAQCFGEVLNRGRNIVRITESELHIVLFFTSGVWLVVMDSRGELVSRIKMKWTDGGSALMLQSFLKVELPPFMIIVQHALRSQQLQFTPARYDFSVEMPQPVSPYLGAGAAGVVYRVQRRVDQRWVALKVVLGHFPAQDLKRHFDTWTQHKSDSKFAALVAGCEYFEECFGGAFLISSDVGIAAHHALLGFKAKSSRVSFLTRVFCALRDLHSLGFKHGDARLPNIVEIRKHRSLALQWIDYCHMRSSSSVDDRYFDWELMVQSVFGCLNYHAVASQSWLKEIMGHIQNLINSPTDYASADMEVISKMIFNRPADFVLTQ